VTLHKSSDKNLQKIDETVRN